MEMKSVCAGAALKRKQNIDYKFESVFIKACLFARRPARLFVLV